MTNEEVRILEQGNDLLIQKISAQIPTEKDSGQRNKLKYLLKKTIKAGEKLEEIVTEEDLKEEEEQKNKNLNKVENETK